MLKFIGYGIVNKWEHLDQHSLAHNKIDVPDPKRIDEAWPETAPHKMVRVLIDDEIEIDG